MTPILAPLHAMATAVENAARPVHRVDDEGGFAAAYLTGFSDALRVAFEDRHLARAILEAITEETGIEGSVAMSLLAEFRAAVR